MQATIAYGEAVEEYNSSLVPDRRAQEQLERVDRDIFNLKEVSPCCHPHLILCVMHSALHTRMGTHSLPMQHAHHDIKRAHTHIQSNMRTMASIHRKPIADFC